MFLFKKIVSQFFFPMPLCLFFCFGGLAFLWWTNKQKTGKTLVTLGLVLLTTLSYQPIADALLLPLERRYPAYKGTDPHPVKYIVVLGGGATSDPNLPLSSRLSDASLKRLVEGIRLFREHPDCQLILSGGSWLDSVSEAEILAQTAKLLGISSEALIIEPESKDTADQARFIKHFVGTNSFFLVTSANHMPRSMALFERQGLKPWPAPTEHLVRARHLEPGVFFPNGCDLNRTDRAFYEWMGTIWAAMTRHLL